MPKAREEDGDERAVELDGVLDDDEAVFGVLEGGDEEAADETEDEDVALHDGVVKKYILAWRRLSLPLDGVDIRTGEDAQDSTYCGVMMPPTGVRCGYFFAPGRARCIASAMASMYLSPLLY